MKKTLLSALFCVLTFTLAAAPQPAASWKMDEGNGNVIKDAGSLKLDGKILYPANTEWVEGRNGGKALYFKGDPAKKHNGGCVCIANVKQLGLDKPFTISCWFKPASKNKMPREAQYEILSNAVGDRGPGFRITFRWNEICFMSGDGKDIKFIIVGKSSQFPVEREAWHHVAVSLNEKGATLYLNGVKVAEQEGKNLVGSANFYFGSYNGGYAYSFIGAISDVKFYKQALTAAEVLAEAKGLDVEE